MKRIVTKYGPWHLTMCCALRWYSWAVNILLKFIQCSLLLTIPVILLVKCTCNATYFTAFRYFWRHAAYGMRDKYLNFKGPFTRFRYCRQISTAHMWYSDGFVCKVFHRCTIALSMSYTVGARGRAPCGVEQWRRSWRVFELSGEGLAVPASVHRLHLLAFTLSLLYWKELFAIYFARSFCLYWREDHTATLPPTRDVVRNLSKNERYLRSRRAMQVLFT